ncbi:thioesterase II family protein [Chroogloeocystis siderophila]|jgi:medium-chain acyl-[acyl-carrier-protein] hydrolase|uniref:Putative thioesterase n=1 Tax=Chroogloeocystis siderophila 5.2 s.c.1 TaxID=247279 RepID=A0A1U7HXS4_9CHRO|nr:thioesterase II family protein [Chroogloeocystis siderophila]OKH28423.1 putative thioesterase [Chroogloeocystis siderophila 5.2 s.c.1]
MANFVTYLSSNPLADVRLFCFPYAGGGTLSFRSWGKNLPVLEVCAIELPGRGRLMTIPPFTQLEPLVEAIATNILPHLNKPFAFFGHSMGAIVSFELTRILRKNYGIEPLHLFVSGRRAPQTSSEASFIHTLPEPEFLIKLRHLNGTPEAILANAELMELLSPILRADFAAVETYVYTEESPLNCSITAFGGLQDPEVNFTELEAWQQQTIAAFSVEMFPGDHFFLHSAEDLLLHSIEKSLQIGNGERGNGKA